MICPYCKTDNIEGSDECANCGQSLYGLDLPGGAKRDEAPDFINEPLSRLPQREVATVSISEPVSLAVRRMQSSNTAVVLVMELDRLVGVITAWDVLHKVAGLKEDLLAVTCGEVMTPDPIVFQPDDRIALVLNRMATGEFRHAPVMDGDKPVNVIDVNDVFRFISPQIL